MSIASDLEKRVLEAQKAYYAGDPIMPDAEYDVLEAQLRAVAPNSKVLQKVGTDGSGRIKHDRPMLSIENMYTEAEVLAWVAQLPQGTKVSLEPKFDGISVSLKYVDGKLVQALTRGDGESGEDITAQVKATKIPQTLKAMKNVEVRGELIMKNSTLERINKQMLAEGKKPYASTRNLTAGTMKTSDLKVVADREITIRPWDVINGSTLPDSAFTRLEMLKKEGFPEPLVVIVERDQPRDVARVLDIKLEQRETILRAQHSLETDGVVIKVDSHDLRQKLGVASKYTNYQICFKPQSASATTILKDVVWQVGRQGKLTPVAEVIPVTLAGAQVQRAGLNNITWIDQMNLQIGGKVEILRSGDVIPIITRAIDNTGAIKIYAPTECPECQGKILVWTDPSSEITTHWCTNERCPGRVRDYFTFIADREYLEIDALGPEMASTIITAGLAWNIADLFELGNEFQSAGDRLLQKNGFSIANARKMVSSLGKAKTADWDRWIAALGIPMIGRSLGKIISKFLQLKETDMTELPRLFASFPEGIEGIGERKLEEIRNWGKNSGSQVLCNKLAAAGVKPTGTKIVAAPVGGTPLAGLTFVITGEFNENRDSITAKLESLGAKSQSGVSKKTQLLIVGDAPGKSKLTKAQELGVKKVGVEYLVETFAKSGVQFDAGDFEHADAN